ncbi:MAG: hypothetical protein NUV76_12925, partial [Candidatus Kuenenia sp.]|nr:hypothetical protein [Candidatus Kuenenia sp.]
LNWWKNKGSVPFFLFVYFAEKIKKLEIFVTIQRNLLNYRSTTRFKIHVWERNGTGNYIRGFRFATVRLSSRRSLNQTFYTFYPAFYEQNK